MYDSLVGQAALQVTNEGNDDTAATPPPISGPLMPMSPTR
jgi:hypothetical protein